ncbi:hypothetical protein AYO44_03830 [Planctomycetaceae bacterium SCGC AG-212-F19]|nr:hypothetical protein AYO44_03830 [Planctomycetaceae bacterium SCGC AG-212-F19]
MPAVGPKGDYFLWVVQDLFKMSRTYLALLRRGEAVPPQARWVLDVLTRRTAAAFNEFHEAVAAGEEPGLPEDIRGWLTAEQDRQEARTLEIMAAVLAAK